MNFSPDIAPYFMKFVALIGALLGFALLVIIHELGHFSFCKLFGVHTPSFSIGMGPILYKKRLGTTDFLISALPLGGYVEIAGMAEIAQGEQKHANAVDETSFQSKPYWQRFTILIGGILFNIIFAYLVYIGLFAFGMPSMTRLDGIKIMNIRQNSAAEKHGLCKNDCIIGVEKISFKEQPYTLQDFLKFLLANPHQTINLSVLHGDIVKQLTVTLESRMDGNKEVGMIGATFDAVNPEYTNEKHSFIDAIKKGVEAVNAMINNIVEGLKMLFKERTFKDMGGPVMILAQTFKSAEQGITFLLILLAIISVNLAIWNLLPLGALDGGQLIFTTIETIIRKPLPEIVRIIINVASLVLFVGLALYLTYTDIIKLFGLGK